MLLRLQQRELKASKGKDLSTIRELANHICNWLCFNCGKISHFIKDYKEPKKDREQPQDLDKGHKKDKKKGKGSKDSKPQ
jgi:hypothetical protein